jgi:pimeloyl-ACP methyl ester carboxylesterase
LKKGYVETPAGWMYSMEEGEGEPVIWLHQSNFSSGEFAKVTPLVAGEYRCIAPDTMGYGWSDPAPLDWEFKDWVDVVPRFMDGLGIEKAHLVGHHTGALLVAAVAAHYPDRVMKCLMNGCVVPEPETAAKFYEAQKQEPLIGPLEIRRDGSQCIRMWKWQQRENPDSPDIGVLYATIANWEHYYKQGGDIFNKYFAYDLRDDFPKIKAECLCLMGTKEQFNPNQPGFLDPNLAANTISGAKTLLVEGAGILFWYDMPERGAQIVIDFLKGREVK